MKKTEFNNCLLMVLYFFPVNRKIPLMVNTKHPGFYQFTISEIYKMIF